MFSTILVVREQQRAANVKGITLKSKYQVIHLCFLYEYMSLNFLSFNFVAFKPMFSPKPFGAEVHILKEDGNEENEGILFYIKPRLIIFLFYN